MTENRNPYAMGSLRHQPAKVTRLRRALLPATAAVLGCAVVGSLAYQMFGASTPAPQPERKTQTTGTRPLMDLPTDYVPTTQPQQPAYPPPAAPPPAPDIPPPINVAQPPPA